MANFDQPLRGYHLRWLVCFGVVDEVRRANRSSGGLLSVVGGVEIFSVIVYRRGQLSLSSAVESDTKLVRMLPLRSLEAASAISVFLVCMGSP